MHQDSCYLIIVLQTNKMNFIKVEKKLIIQLGCFLTFIRLYIKLSLFLIDHYKKYMKKANTNLTKVVTKFVLPDLHCTFD